MTGRLRSPRGAVSLLQLLIALGLALSAAFAGGIYFALQYRRNAGRTSAVATRRGTPRYPSRSAAPPPPPAEPRGENAAPSGNASLRFRFSWNGAPLPPNAPVPKLSLVRADERGVYRFRISADQTAVTREGAEASGLAPGRYLLYADASNRRREPGSWWYGGALADPILIPGPSDLEIPLLRIMSVLQPPDDPSKTRDRSRKWEDLPVLPRPLEFSWRPLVPNAVYEVEIGKLDLERHSFRPGAAQRLTTTGTSVKLDLPPSEKPWVYAFEVYASVDGRRIGRTFFQSEDNWLYEFR